MKNKALTVLGLMAALVSASAWAQQSYTQTTEGTVLDVPADARQPATRNLPTHTMSKAAVRREFGPPEQVFAPVGDPPITRWDYPDFRVFFEYDLVLHSVVPGNFPAISNRSQLTPAR